MQPVAESMGKGLRVVGVAIGEPRLGMNFDAILQVIRTGLLGWHILDVQEVPG